jgi:hypothetical protein
MLQPKRGPGGSTEVVYEGMLQRKQRRASALDEVMCPFPTLVLSKQDIYHPMITHSRTLHLATTTDVLMLTYIIL